MPIVMFTSLDGARRNSILPTGGIRPIQLSNRTSRKAPTKIGMYGRAVGPAEADAEVAQELVDELEDVLAATRDQLLPRGSAGGADEHDAP